MNQTYSQPAMPSTQLLNQSVVQSAFSQIEAALNAAFFNAEAAYQYRQRTAQKRLEPQASTPRIIEARILQRSAPERAEVEAFISGVFAKAYGANIQHFMPQLVALRDEHQQLVGAFGLRQAAFEPLFLEQYLDMPIEELLSSRLVNIHPTPVSRNQITEIGNLAVANPRHAAMLVNAIIQYSLSAGIAWCVCTVHHSLQNALVKAGREVIVLHSADKTHLSKEALQDWGSYYQNTPQVVAIRGVVS